MTRTSRWPVAVACLGMGAFGGYYLNGRLIGQPAADPAPVPAELYSYRDVVKRTMPAVVSIESKLKPAPAPNPLKQPGARQPDEPPPDVEPGFGSGVVIDPDGVVLTNNHVVQDAESVEVTLADGRKFVSRDIRKDPKTDLAVVKLTVDKPLPALALGDSDRMEVGDRVLAVGAPFGLTGSVTHGIVSAKGRYNLKLNQYEDFLQTDAAVNPGNSGGPLISLDGRVIGITSAIKTRSGGFQGVGLAISSNLARSVAVQLLKDGVVRRGYLGVGAKDITVDLSAKVGVAVGGGVVVTRVNDGGPAAKAKVEAGDVITSVGGRAVKDSRDLQRAVSTLPIGQPVEVTVTRDGKNFALEAVVEEQAESSPSPKLPPPAQDQPPAGPRPPAAPPAAGVGLTVAELTAESAQQFRLPRTVKGVVITNVVRRGFAEQAGLARGMVVVKVDRQPVASLADFKDALAKADRGRGALLQVLRPTGELDFVALRLE